MRHMASPGQLEKQRTRAKHLREKDGEPATVHYFHQVDDPYSHLAVQKLDQLRAHYQITFQPHLVSQSEPSYQGSADHFTHWARADAVSVAADYQTNLPENLQPPEPTQIAQANAVLAHHLDSDEFANKAIEVGHALWAGQPINGESAQGDGAPQVEEGNALRTRLGHYQGAMFYFDGEWFWGVDRLRLLEERLIAEGYQREAGPICVPQPEPPDTTSLDTSGLLLEYFPSLRSPYTAIGHQRVLDMVQRTGVPLSVRPVLPMMMRGIPAPRAKQRYIMMDSAREGRAFGVPFGKIVDPFGPPVERAFALFPGAAQLGKPMEFVTAYLQAAWFDGVDITKTAGLQQVADHAGLEWQALNQAAQDNDWRSTLDDNLEVMLTENLWGVPSFRVSGGNSSTAYACWGQDRIWRVENEIARRV
ncbi:MAG: DsbA family protein [Pseudomonadota bacterium]